VGIRHLAPCDARSTGIPAESVGVVSNTFTLEHIPERDIAAILAESGRLLRAGIVTCAIDMKDHYSGRAVRSSSSARRRTASVARRWSSVPASPGQQRRRSASVKVHQAYASCSSSSLGCQRKGASAPKVSTGIRVIHGP
jgi:ubiquinone/menaquinone biosynthesis C-methylase UbiE